MTYGNWIGIHAALGSWVMYAASVVIGVEITVEFAMKALHR